MKIHLQVEGSPAKAIDSARAIADSGADGLFTFEGPHDVFIPLVLAAQATGLELMTNVAIAGPRSPMHLAHTAYDLQVLSEGRFSLGLGSQIRPHIEKRYGSQWGKPAQRMAESVAAVKAIFDTWEGKAPLDFRGEFFTHTLLPPTFDPGPNPYGPPPVLMGALGPIMTRTAGEVADGLLVMPFNSTRHFAERTIPALREGLARSGRSLDGYRIIAQVMCAVGSTPEAAASAYERVASLIAFYGSTPAYRVVLDLEGWGQLQPELNALSKRGRFTEMRALITDDMVRTLAVVGTPRECAEQIHDRYGVHASEVCCYFPGFTPDREDLTGFVSAVRSCASGPDSP
ncbi:MAG: TIGR03617 family F420-dependent LLM class oxidoreductase [Gordonia amarae]